MDYWLELHIRCSDCLLPHTHSDFWTNDKRNIKATSNKDILATNSSASQMQQNPIKNFDSSMKPQKTFVSNQKRTPIRSDNKIGRNSKVIIKKGAESKTIKYKNIDKFISQGWELS